MLLDRFPAAWADIVVTSPPYNIGVDYTSHCDTLPSAVYLDWLDGLWRSLQRVLRADGSFFLNLGGAARDPAWPLTVAMRAAGRFSLQNHIIWAKSVHVADKTHGHFKPVNSPRYLNNVHEHLFHFTHRGDVSLDRLAVGVAFADKSNIARWGHATDQRCGGNLWFIPYRTIRSRAQRYHHPAAFPPELAERCIRLHGRAAPRVLDPFVGTGSTLVACARLGAQGIGIEIDAAYCTAAVERLREAA